MSDAIYNDTITITEYEAQMTGKMYRIKTITDEWYTLWRNTKDGTQTKAYASFVELGKAGGLPMTVRIGFKIVKNEKDGKTYENKTIISMTRNESGKPAQNDLEARVASLETKVAYLESRLSSREVTVEELAAPFNTNSTVPNRPLVEGDEGYTDVSQVSF